MQKITTAVASISDMNRGIAVAANQQAAEVERIHASIATIRQMAADTSADVRSTEAAVGDLAKLLQELHTLVAQFRVGGAQLDLSAAKAAHLNWTVRLRAFLDGKATLTEDEAVSHHHCAFGKWYDSEGLKRFGHIHELRQVEEPHAELHRTIKEIVQAMKAGDKDRAERLYASVDGISRRIVTLLEAAEASA